MNFFAGKPVIVAKVNFEAVAHAYTGSATVIPELPPPDQVLDWHSLRHRDLVVVEDGSHPESIAMARAMGHGRIGILPQALSAEKGGGMPLGMHAAELLAMARSEVRKTASSPDISICEVQNLAPRRISLECLGSLGRLVDLAADHSATHRDFVAGLVWPALSGLTGGSITSVVYPGFRQPGILYSAIVGSPGSNKSGAYRALEPAKRAVERWLDSDHKAAMAFWEADNEGKAKAEREKAPMRPLIRLSNATAEAAMMVLHQQGRGFEFQVEEFALILQQLGINAGGSYSNSAPLAGLWLRGFDGGRYDYTRRSVSDEPLLINNFATAVSAAAQPDVLADFFNSPRRDGGPDRLLLAFPDEYSIDEIKGEGDADKVAADLAGRWIELRKAVVKMEKAHDITGDSEIEVKFTPEAAVMFDRWRKHLTAEARFLSPAAQSARMKSISHFVRIAGICGFVRHVIDGEPLGVDTDIVSHVTDTMRGFLDHRYKTERLLSEPLRERRARELAREIVLREAFTFRPSDVRREWRLQLCRDEAGLRDALIELGELGWLKSKVGRNPRDPLPAVVAVVDHVLLEARDLVLKKPKKEK